MDLGGVKMTAETIYQDQDRYADNISTLLHASGIVTEDEQEEMKHYLQGW
jgi:uncharacterized protein YutE (UPF0331/DUF86 family)